MNQLTFIEKLQVLLKLLFSSPIIIGIFAFSMILMIVLFFYSRINKKIIKYGFCVLYVGLIGFAIFKYGKYFLVGIDSFLTLFMANIYFPIIPVYVAIMFISFIIMIFTLGSRRKSRVVKIINTVFFTVIQMLFALFIYIVESNHIDLSSNTGLYSNEQTMTLLELGMGLFVVWIVILLVLLYLKKADKIFKVRKNDNTDDFDEYINDYNVPSSYIKPVVNNGSEINNVGVSFQSNISDNSSSEIFSSSNLDLNSSADDSISDFSLDIVDNLNIDDIMSDTSSVVSNVSNSDDFNTSSSDIVKSLVPELDLNSGNVSNVSDSINDSSNDELVESVDFDVDESRPNIGSTLSSGIFNSFNFLDFEKNRDRRDDDVEVIDF